MPEHSPAGRTEPVIVTLGNPNTGKSTLFNLLTGLAQKVSNFPGVTVEYLSGQTELASGTARLVDVPGTYSLTAQSPDEAIAVRVCLGQVSEVGSPDLALIVVDASNLRRNLFLASQVLELGLPVIIVLNMTDLADQRGITIDVEELARGCDAPVVPIVASRKLGIATLKATIDSALVAPHPPQRQLFPAVREAATELAEELTTPGYTVNPLLMERALIDVDGYAEQQLAKSLGADAHRRLQAVRTTLGQGRNLATLEARERYSWINQLLNTAETRALRGPTKSDLIDRTVNHPVSGTILFLLAMTVIFQAVFAWATPLMDGVDHLAAALGSRVEATLGEGTLSSFLVDGVIAGVGSVVIFLPQIIILFTFIILLEDSGYMARAAFLVDRLMRWCGLSGQSFIPMLSSFACAVPGIMGTRVVGDHQSRIATIIAAPFMTCAARLPIYALLISAFVPAQRYFGGLINLQGLVLLAFYLIGIGAAIGTAFLLNRTVLSSKAPRFLLELPPYRVPNPRSVAMKLWARAGIFLKRAGTIIFAVAVVVWALAYFPRPSAEPMSDPQGNTTAITSATQNSRLDQSYLGRMSQTIAPIFAPLGWDWKTTAAVLASFPAREVVIAVLGTLYAVDAPADEGRQTLMQALQQSRHSDGRLVYNLPVALGLMAFYALCLQCVSTIAVMKRETNSWRWPIFAWLYMTVIGYLGALIVYRLSTALVG